MQYPVLDHARHTQAASYPATDSWAAWQGFLFTRRRPTIGSRDTLQTFFEPSPQVLESTSRNQFTQRIRLCLISHQIGSALYSAAAGLQSWSDFQAKLAGLDAAMLAWREGLPSSIHISPKEIQDRHPA
jgi:hypothetical protein